MDQFDLTKPLCIFILDLNPDSNASSPPEQIIREYVDSGSGSGQDLGDVTDGPDEASDAFPVPCPAIRGSTLPFGGWGRPKRSVKISSDHYALVVNNPIPPGTEYKWLDMSGRGIPGDIDPRTRYSYEPDPYIDRPVTFRTPVPGEELVIVMDRWGDYKSRVAYTKLDKWIAHENFEGALTNLNIKQDHIQQEFKIETEHVELQIQQNERVKTVSPVIKSEFKLLERSQNESVENSQSADKHGLETTSGKTQVNAVEHAEISMSQKQSGYTIITTENVVVESKIQKQSLSNKYSDSNQGVSLKQKDLNPLSVELDKSDISSLNKNTDSNETLQDITDGTKLSNDNVISDNLEINETCSNKSLSENEKKVSCKSDKKKVVNKSDILYSVSGETIGSKATENVIKSVETSQLYTKISGLPESNINFSQTKLTSKSVQMDMPQKQCEDASLKGLPVVELANEAKKNIGGRKDITDSKNRQKDQIAENLKKMDSSYSTENVLNSVDIHEEFKTVTLQTEECVQLDSQKVEGELPIDSQALRRSSSTETKPLSNAAVIIVAPDEVQENKVADVSKVAQILNGHTDGENITNINGESVQSRIDLDKPGEKKTKPQSGYARMTLSAMEKAKEVKPYTKKDDAQVVHSSTARPSSLTESSTPLRKFRPFSSLSSDMKFHKMTRSTEEIFIEKSPGKNKVSKDSSGSDSDGFLSTPTRSGSASPMEPYGQEEDVFNNGKSTIFEESTEESNPKDEKLSKVILKDVFSDMMNRARKFSNDFVSKQSSYSTLTTYTTTNQGRKSYQRSTVTPDRYHPKVTYNKGPRAAKSLSSLYDPSLDQQNATTVTNTFSSQTPSKDFPGKDSSGTESFITDMKQSTTSVGESTKKHSVVTVESSSTYSYSEKGSTVVSYTGGKNKESNEGQETGVSHESGKPSEEFTFSPKKNDETKSSQITEQIVHSTQNVLPLDSKNIGNINGSEKTERTFSSSDNYEVETQSVKHTVIQSEEATEVNTQMNNTGKVLKQSLKSGMQENNKEDGVRLSSTETSVDHLSEGQEKVPEEIILESSSLIFSQVGKVGDIHKKSKNEPNIDRNTQSTSEHTDIIDEAYRKEQEIMVSRVSIDLDDSSDSINTQKHSVLASYKETVMVPKSISPPSPKSKEQDQPEDKHIKGKSEYDNKTELETENAAEETQESEDILKDIDGKQGAKARPPSLKDTKKFKSFETSFEGEDYIVVDLPSEAGELEVTEAPLDTDGAPVATDDKQEILALGIQNEEISESVNSEFSSLSDTSINVPADGMKTDEIACVETVENSHKMSKLEGTEISGQADFVTVKSGQQLLKQVPKIQKKSSQNKEAIDQSDLTNDNESLVTDTSDAVEDKVEIPETSDISNVKSTDMSHETVVMTSETYKMTDNKFSTVAVDDKVVEVTNVTDGKTEIVTNEKQSTADAASEQKRLQVSVEINLAIETEISMTDTTDGISGNIVETANDYKSDNTERKLVRDDADVSFPKASNSNATDNIDMAVNNKSDLSGVTDEQESISAKLLEAINTPVNEPVQDHEKASPKADDKVSTEIEITTVSQSKSKKKKNKKKKGKADSTSESADTFENTDKAPSEINDGAVSNESKASSVNTFDKPETDKGTKNITKKQSDTESFDEEVNKPDKNFKNEQEYKGIVNTSWTQEPHSNKTVPSEDISEQKNKKVNPVANDTSSIEIEITNTGGKLDALTADTSVQNIKESNLEMKDNDIKESTASSQSKTKKKKKKKKGKADTTSESADTFENTDKASLEINAHAESNEAKASSASTSDKPESHTDTNKPSNSMLTENIQTAKSIENVDISVEYQKTEHISIQDTANTDLNLEYQRQTKDMTNLKSTDKQQDKGTKNKTQKHYEIENSTESFNEEELNDQQDYKGIVNTSWKQESHSYTSVPSVDISEQKTQKAHPIAENKDNDKGYPAADDKLRTKNETTNTGDELKHLNADTSVQDINKSNLEMKDNDTKETDITTVSQSKSKKKKNKKKKGKADATTESADMSENTDKATSEINDHAESRESKDSSASNSDKPEPNTGTNKPSNGIITESDKHTDISLVKSDKAAKSTENVDISVEHQKVEHISIQETKTTVPNLEMIDIQQDKVTKKRTKKHSKKGNTTESFEVEVIEPDKNLTKQQDYKGVVNTSWTQEQHSYKTVPSEDISEQKNKKVNPLAEDTSSTEVEITNTGDKLDDLTADTSVQNIKESNLEIKGKDANETDTTAVSQSKTKQKKKKKKNKGKTDTTSENADMFENTDKAPSEINDRAESNESETNSASNSDKPELNTNTNKPSNGIITENDKHTDRSLVESDKTAKSTENVDISVEYQKAEHIAIQETKNTDVKLKYAKELKGVQQDKGTQDIKKQSKIGNTTESFDVEDIKLDKNPDSQNEYVGVVNTPWTQSQIGPNDCDHESKTKTVEQGDDQQEHKGIVCEAWNQESMHIVTEKICSETLDEGHQEYKGIDNQGLNYDAPLRKEDSINSKEIEPLAEKQLSLAGKQDSKLEDDMTEVKPTDEIHEQKISKGKNKRNKNKSDVQKSKYTDNIEAEITGDIKSVTEEVTVKPCQTVEHSIVINKTESENSKTGKNITATDSTVDDVPLTATDSTVDDVPLTATDSTVDVPLTATDSTVDDVPLTATDSTVDDVPQEENSYDSDEYVIIETDEISTKENPVSVETEYNFTEQRETELLHNTVVTESIQKSTQNQTLTYSSVTSIKTLPSKATETDQKPVKSDTHKAKKNEQFVATDPSDSSGINKKHNQPSIISQDSTEPNVKSSDSFGEQKIMKEDSKTFLYKQNENSTAEIQSERTVTEVWSGENKLDSISSKSITQERVVIQKTSVPTKSHKDIEEKSSNPVDTDEKVVVDDQNKDQTSQTKSKKKGKKKQNENSNATENIVPVENIELTNENNIACAQEENSMSQDQISGSKSHSSELLHSTVVTESIQQSTQNQTLTYSSVTSTKTLPSKATETDKKPVKSDKPEAKKNEQFVATDPSNSSGINKKHNQPSIISQDSTEPNVKSSDSFGEQKIMKEDSKSFLIKQNENSTAEIQSEKTVTEVWTGENKMDSISSKSITQERVVIQKTSVPTKSHKDIEEKSSNTVVTDEKVVVDDQNKGQTSQTKSKKKGKKEQNENSNATENIVPVENIELTNENNFARAQEENSMSRDQISGSKSYSSEILHNTVVTDSIQQSTQNQTLTYSSVTSTKTLPSKATETDKKPVKSDTHKAKKNEQFLAIDPSDSSGINKKYNQPSIISQDSTEPNRKSSDSVDEQKMKKEDSETFLYKQNENSTAEIKSERTVTEVWTGENKMDSISSKSITQECVVIQKSSVPTKSHKYIEEKTSNTVVTDEKVVVDDQNKGQTSQTKSKKKGKKEQNENSNATENIVPVENIELTNENNVTSAQEENFMSQDHISESKSYSSVLATGIQKKQHSLTKPNDPRPESTIPSKQAAVKTEKVESSKKDNKTEFKKQKFTKHDQNKESKSNTAIHSEKDTQVQKQNASVEDTAQKVKKSNSTSSSKDKEVSEKVETEQKSNPIDKSYKRATKTKGGSKKKKGGKRKNDQWKASSEDKDTTDPDETEDESRVTVWSGARRVLDGTCCLLVLLIVICVILCFTVYNTMYNNEEVTITTDQFKPKNEL